MKEDWEVELEKLINRIDSIELKRITHRDSIVWAEEIKRKLKDLVVDIVSNHRISLRSRTNIASMTINAAAMIIWFAEIG